jgi:hypothetical protein
MCKASVRVVAGLPFNSPIIKLNPVSIYRLEHDEALIVAVIHDKRVLQ